MHSKAKYKMAFWPACHFLLVVPRRTRSTEISISSRKFLPPEPKVDLKGFHCWEFKATIQALGEQRRVA